jgi:hypothetical protein
MRTFVDKQAAPFTIATTIQKTYYRQTEIYTGKRVEV